MIYQAMFAVITPALITGAFAERLKFSSFLVFIFFWSLLVYYPVAHWVWGIGGWIRNLGALDFAGGTVVHITSGASALAAGGLSTSAFVATHMAASAAMLSWTVAEWIHRGKPTVLGAASSAVYAFAVTYLLFRILDKTMGLRVPHEEEVMGLDLTQHGEAGYNW